MIRAVFLDVDGTLFSHSVSDIPPSALTALHRLREKGILLFLATGRHMTGLRRLNLHDFPFDGYVTLTGHLCYDREWNTVYREPLPPEDTAILARAYRERRVPLMLMLENRSCINYMDELAAAIFKDVSSAPPDDVPYSGEAVYSAAVYCAPETARSLERELPGCRLSAWHPNGFDIISRCSGKVRGMEEIMRLHDLHQEEIAAFGDEDNDVEMLSFAAKGIAMGNGTGRAKAVADYVTSPIDADGLLNGFRFLGLL